MSDLHLLRKNELRIDHIHLQNANLNEVAEVVADCLGMERSKVLVTDVRDDVLTLDLLVEVIDSERLLGKGKQTLERLGDLPGVEVTAQTVISSRGVLGWIALDEERARKALARSEEMAEELLQRISKRAIVFSTGAEVDGGQIEDTNTPTIAKRLEAEGYTVAIGTTLPDDDVFIAGKLRQAVFDDGHGLVITTGGVGAEDKDRTVEALLQLDPNASTPYIAKFEKGTGRHRKEGVRIGVGRLLDAMIVNLPGPNDEVRASLDILVDGLAKGVSAAELAHDLAGNLREDLAKKMAAWGHSSPAAS